MALNRGQAIGRSTVIDYNNLTSNLQREDQLMRQAQADRQAKNEKLAAGMDFPGDFNKWDDPLVKGFVDEHVNAIGQYVTENPDLANNPAKLIKFNQMKKELMSNPAVSKAKRIDTEYKAYQQFIKSDKDGLWANSPEYQQLEQEWQNYANFGDIAGEAGGGGEFKFRHPGKKIDLEQVFQSAGGAVEFDGLEGYGGDYGSRQFITEERKVRIAQTLIDDTGINGRTLRQNIKELQDNGQLGTDDADVLKYVRNRLDPYMAADKLDKGWKPESDAPGAGNGAGTQFADPYSAWMNGYSQVSPDLANGYYLPGQTEGSKLVPMAGLNVASGTNDNNELNFVNIPASANRDFKIKYIGGTEYGNGRNNGGYEKGGMVGMKSLVTVTKEDLQRNPEMLKSLGEAGLIEDTQWFAGWLWNEDEFLDADEIKGRKSSEAWFSGEGGNTFNFVAYYPHKNNPQEQMNTANKLVKKGIINERTGDTYGEKVTMGVVAESDGTFSIKDSRGTVIQSGFSNKEDAIAAM